jgi:hypothetical protein
MSMGDGNTTLTGFKIHLIGPDAKDNAGEPILVLADRNAYAHMFMGYPLTDEVAKAAAHRKPQLAYELVASDDLVDFYRVCSILRLKNVEKDTPTFVFVD